LAEILDYWNIFTFNIHGHWESVANHHAPFANVKFEDADINSGTMVNIIWGKSRFGIFVKYYLLRNPV